MEQAEAHTAAKHLLAVGLVGLIGLVGLVMMFTEIGATGQATALRISDYTIAGCNAGELLLNAQGIEALKEAGRAIYGPDFSPYHDAHISYNGVGYCADAVIVRELLG
jgi:hypothetical protein